MGSSKVWLHMVFNPRCSAFPAVSCGAGMSTARKGAWHCCGSMDLLRVEVHTAPEFTTPYKPSIVTS